MSAPPPTSSSASATLRSRARTANTPQPHDERVDGWGAIARGAVHVLASHGLLAIAGVASLPFLVRNLGPASFGAFSLFLTLLGCIAYQDFLRPLLIREQALERSARERFELDALGRVLPLALSPIALLLAWPFLGFAAALVLAACVGLHAAASPAYARLALAGRASFAASVRNVAWALATAATCALSFATSSALAWLAPFLAANALIAIVYARAAPVARGARSAIADDARAAWSAVRRHRAAISDLFGFNVAAAVAACADRALLVLFVPAAAFGAYAAAVDLALKVDLVGAALAALLQPALTRRLQRDGFDVVAKSFVRASSWILLGLALVVGLAITAASPIVKLALGSDFVAQKGVFALALAGTFVHMLGFLLTPWQRARGDFATPRRAYWASALAVLAVGVFAIPAWGAMGALCALLASRVGEVVLLAGELRALSRQLLPRWHIAALAVVITALFAGAAAM